MKMIVIAGLIAVVGAVGAMMVLNERFQRPVYEAYSTTGARVGDPGDNLVGRDWPSVYKADHRS
ncbi:hypothetical protein [Alsobacter sp. R-9]